MPMASQNFTVVIEEGEDGYYIADVPELPGCHTQAKSMDELLKRVKEATEANLEANKDSTGTKFIGIQRIEITR